MEIIKLIALLLGSALLFTCCSSASMPNLSYQKKSFRAHIFWETPNISVGAIFTSIAKDEEDTASRIITLEFTSPENLCVIKVTKSGEDTSVSLDGMQISAPYAESYLEIAKFFDIEATVKESSVQELDGVSLNFIRAVSDSGEEYSLHLHKNSGLPRRICGTLGNGECTLDVISFEFIPE